MVHSDRDLELIHTCYGEGVSGLQRRLFCLIHGPEAIENMPQRQACHPEQFARRYRDIIEQSYTSGPRAGEAELVEATSRTLAPASPSRADLAAVATAVAANREEFGLPQLLVDVTVLADFDARTGIQRVTRAILMALINDPPAGYRVEPVRAVGEAYVYARRFTCRCLGLAEHALTDDPVETRRGDVIVSLEWAANLLPSMKPWFLQQRCRGIRAFFVCHDLLALRHPQFFPPEIAPLALGWLQTVSEVADGVVCISRTIADELFHWLSEQEPRRRRALPIGYFHLGADLHESLPSEGRSQEVLLILPKLRCRPSFVMVGTVEPRQGNRQALAAMELLWADRVDANLIIVGSMGWMMEDLAERIQQHPERDERLFWLQGISDEMLEEVYRSARALLAASEGEGFGLPLIEAAKYGLQIIARDIPVFREVAGQHAFYFRGEDPQALADALRAWLSLGEAAPSSKGIPWLTWHQSSRQLLGVALGEQWYRYWRDAPIRLRSAIVSADSESSASTTSCSAVSLE
jgi:glycosyltransferase involved in cell wall biosynthesis